MARNWRRRLAWRTASTGSIPTPRGWSRWRACSCISRRFPGSAHGVGKRAADLLEHRPRRRHGRSGSDAAALGAAGAQCAHSLHRSGAAGARNAAADGGQRGDAGPDAGCGAARGQSASEAAVSARLRGLHAADQLYVSLLLAGVAGFDGGRTLDSLPLSMANTLESQRSGLEVACMASRSWCGADAGGRSAEGSRFLRCASRPGRVTLRSRVVDSCLSATLEGSGVIACCAGLAPRLASSSTGFGEAFRTYMALIQGLAAHAAGAELLPFRYDPGELRPQEVEIRISHCGICHSDLHLISNDWGISQFPLIPGPRDYRQVAAVGSEVQNAGGGPAGRRGLAIELLRTVRVVQRRAWKISAPPRKLPAYIARRLRAESVRVNARFAIPIPDAINSEGAAPLLCGGITVYNPLRAHGINPSSRVGIVGIGGLGHMALQFARVFGAEVTAFSTSDGQRRRSARAGRAVFCEYARIEGHARVAGKFDFILTPSTPIRIGIPTSRRCALREHCALSACRRRRSRCMPFR
jgi:uncharacterized zinc-type alcohol dehydrogenase-like protein